MVHSYLMYGYPTQTIQETVDSLEMVRQLFEIGILQSGFWHQFALTAHSPIGINPSEYGVTPNYQSITFANNDIDFEDKTGIDHGAFSFGLKKSLYNYMHDIGFELPLQEWFDFNIPRTKVKPNYIEACLAETSPFNTKPSHKILWLGTQPFAETYTKSKRGDSWQMQRLEFQLTADSVTIQLDKTNGDWLLKTLPSLSVTNKNLLSFSELKMDYEKEQPDFELFWYSKSMNILRENGLLAV